MCNVMCFYITNRNKYTLSMLSQQKYKYKMRAKFDIEQMHDCSLADKIIEIYMSAKF